MVVKPVQKATATIIANATVLAVHVFLSQTATSLWLEQNLGAVVKLFLKLVISILYSLIIMQ